MGNKLYGTVLLKADKILDVLSDGKSKSLQQIATSTGISASTVSKILTTLSHMHYVTKSDTNKRFHLGAKLIQFGQVQTGATDLIELTHLDLDRLQAKIDETIHLSVLENNKAVYVRKMEPQHQNIFMTSKVGIARELYSSGMGKAMLTTFDETALAHYLSVTKLVPFTDFTITDEMQLRRSVHQAQLIGYAIDDEEQEKDCFCVATTLCENDQLLGAMSISVPKFRVTPQYRNLIIQELMKAKQRIEGRLSKNK
ncbi:MAG: IclR family transcriptional regulator [Lactobacillus sp.]|nr:MAG: IclR family transcriptional regulator [Lactobacillus sp.]